MPQTNSACIGNVMIRVSLLSSGLGHFRPLHTTHILFSNWWTRYVVPPSNVTKFPISLRNIPDWTWSVRFSKHHQMLTRYYRTYSQSGWDIHHLDLSRCPLLHKRVVIQPGSSGWIFTRLQWITGTLVPQTNILHVFLLIFPCRKVRLISYLSVNHLPTQLCTG